MKYKFLLEASGTLIAGFMIKSVQKVGAVAIASDITECAGTYIADDFIVFPKAKDPQLWNFTERIIKEKGINVVVPTLDETLISWAQKKQYYLEKGVHILISDATTLQIFQDKWNTYNFFVDNQVPTPISSLEHDFDVVKPREGRGGQGVTLDSKPRTINMEGMISQEKLKGQEYTIDVFCDNLGKPIYIVPRVRLNVINGKSTGGKTVNHPVIIEWVERICSRIKFFGPINLQCFELENGEIKFTEINPRLGGGTALGITATENWVNLMIENLIENKPINAKPIKFGLNMYRYYCEVFN
jgi:carbamoyl-phosphate synthase large subunit